MRPCISIITALCLLFCSGCSGLSSNYREIEQMRLIHTIGFDLEKNQLLLSVSGGAHENLGVTKLSAKGQNITDAMAQLQCFSNNEELYYAHTRFILMGEEYAKNGVTDLLDYIEHSPQLRTDSPLFVIRGDTAENVLLNAGGEDHSIYNVLEVVISDCKKRGNSYPFTCGDVVVGLNEYGGALVCALSIKPTNSVNPEAEEEEVTPVVSGYGILKNGKLVGYISEDSAMGVNILLGKTGDERVTVNLNRSPVSLHFTKVKHKITADWGEHGTITKLHVNVELAATIEEGFKRTDGNVSGYEQALAAEVEGWIQQVLGQMSNTRTDFLGFGRKLAITDSKNWNTSPVSWESQLATMPTEVHVSCKLSASENERLT